MNDHVAVDAWARGFICRKLVVGLIHLEEKFPSPRNLSVLECKKSISCFDL